MNRLLEIGFQPAGHWLLNEDGLSFELLRHGSQRNVLYAFVSDGHVQYVGKTVQPLARRMHGYKNPGPGQSTNIKNHELIKDSLQEGAAVDILVLPDNGLLHYGQFHVNLAAGLEDNVIAVLQPPWNGKRRLRKEDRDELLPDLPTPGDSFVVVLQPTYFNTGFFNVPARHAHSFGGDGEEIEIYCGLSSKPITGSINRRANANGSPRIMGGAGLRDCFQQHAEERQRLTIEVYSRNSIRIER
jgi:hypothetical protein